MFLEVNVTWKSVSSQVGSRENSFPTSRNRSSRHSVSSLLFLPTDIRIPISKSYVVPHKESLRNWMCGYES